LEIVMDRRLFLLAELAAFVGIVAGGYTLISSTRDSAVAASPPEQVTREAVLPQRIAARTAAPIAAARPPVPLLLSPHPPREAADLPPAEATADGGVSQQTQAGQADEQATAEAAARAKALIEADGYKRVRAVARAPDGRWRGLALRGAEEVAVSVDDNGNVSTQ
jgi:hypothetical protein